MHEADRAANVATCLDPLRDDHVTACIGRSTSLINRADLPRCQRAMVMDHSHELSTWIAVEELDNSADFSGLLDELARGLCCGAARSDDEGHAECAGCHFPR